VSTPRVEFPRRELAFREEHGGFSLTLKRNCSISPAGLAGVFGVLALAVLTIGIAFAALGAWLILPFAGLEVLLLVAAFVQQARHATDYERIGLARGQLRVEVAQAQTVSRYELDARGVRIDVQGAQVTVSGQWSAVALGRHLDGEARLAFADELKKRLRI
jgi:uncharacterized membrane protein